MHRIATFLLLAACSEYDINKERGTEPADTPLPDTAPPDDETCEGSRAPSPYEVSVDESCVAEPVVGTFTPTVEWQWATDTVHGGD